MACSLFIRSLLTIVVPFTLVAAVNKSCLITVYTYGCFKIGRLVLKKKTCFSAGASTLNMGLINKG